MKGVQLFTHSIQQVIGNLGPALRISGVLYVVQIAASLIFGVSFMVDGEASAAAMRAGSFPWGGFLAVILVSLVTSLWIAVGWHRYVLRLESPNGIVPPLHADRMLAYFGRSILLAIVLMLIGMVIGFVVGLVLYPILGRSPGMGTAFLFVVLIYVPVVVVSYRLSLSLPGAALGEPMGFGASWEATKGAGGDILVLGILSVVSAAVIDLPPVWIFPNLKILATAWQLVSSWVFLMVGISILTTLYGHYAERRPLV
jgi:hypothetical protein